MLKYSIISKKNNIKSIAIGNFDGMHLGHQELFKRLGDKGAIIVISKETSTLTPKRERQLFTKYPCFTYKLKDIVFLTGKEFIDLIKNDFPNLKKIVIGYDFKFGINRTCDAQYLIDHCNKKVEIVPEYFVDGVSVHSSYIINQIINGDIKIANKLLARNYSIRGKVVNGQGIGKSYLYATLNIEVKGYCLPKDGVYATYTKIHKKIYKSISFVGKRLSTDGKFSIETHILDKTKLPKTKFARIFFIDKIRKNKKFNDLKKLKEEIAKDVIIARNILEKDDLGHLFNRKVQY